MAAVPERLIPLAAMEKLMKQAGATRVAESAKKALKEVLEELANNIATSAVMFAQHAGRKTVKAGDIKLAIKQS